jgi:hypothetical protein
MDPLLVPEKRLLLSPGAQDMADRRLTAGETAHATGDAVAKEHAKSTMLPRRYEVVNRGALFHWGFACRVYSALEVDTLHLMASAFLANAQVGGKRATGHGGMTPVAWRGIPTPAVSQPSEALAAGFGPKVGEIFREHVGERRERIRELLRKVDA